MIEQALGREIPGDYRLLAETLPPGQFDYLFVRTPGLYDDENGYIQQIRETAEEVRDYLEEFYDLPFGFFPEQGGFTPWANIDFDTFVGWVNYQGVDQIASVDFSGEWDMFPGGTLEFLVSVVSGAYRPPEVLDSLGLRGYPLKFYPTNNKS